MSKRTITLEQEQWSAIAKAARIGICAHDLLGPDEPDWNLDEKTVNDAHQALRKVEEHARDIILGREHMPPVSIEPERFRREQAVSEGWYIDIDEVRNEWAIHALEDGPFKTNDAAHDRVVKLAGAGSEYHEYALGWIDRGNVLLRAAAPKTCVQLGGLRPAEDLTFPELPPFPELQVTRTETPKRGMFARMFGSGV